MRSAARGVQEPCLLVRSLHMSRSMSRSQRRAQRVRRKQARSPQKKLLPSLVLLVWLGLGLACAAAGSAAAEWLCEASGACARSAAAEVPLFYAGLIGGFMPLVVVSVGVLRKLPRLETAFTGYEPSGSGLPLLQLLVVSTLLPLAYLMLILGAVVGLTELISPGGLRFLAWVMSLPGLIGVIVLSQQKIPWLQERRPRK